MRTLRLSLVGVVILALGGGLAGAVLAQTEDESAPLPVYVTGLWQSEDTSDVTYDRWFEGNVEHRRVAGVSETWEWSDPRLPGEWTVTLDQQFFDVPGVGQVTSWTFTSIEANGPDGSWAVNARGLSHPAGVPSRDGASIVVLEGRDGYDGLQAILDCGTAPEPEEGDAEPPNCEGYILEGQPPQLPAPAPEG